MPKQFSRRLISRAQRAVTAALDKGPSDAEIKFREEFLNFEKLSSSAASNRFQLSWDDRFPCLDDKTPATKFDRHYVYHTAWAARVLARTRPASHVDISSYLYFATLVSAFVPIKFYDYRPADVRLSNLTAEAVDLLALPFQDGSIDSLSCMHVVEHMGLGRYSDPLDPNGDLKAIAELKRVLAPSGALLFVVPIGKPRVVFNAHRIYSFDQVCGYFSELTLKEFALIPDKPEDGDLVYGAAPEMADAQDYGCGCFWFTRDHS